MSAGPQLSSVATRLTELTTTITDIADEMKGSPADAVATELYEVERSLLAASRRLEKVVEELL